MTRQRPTPFSHAPAGPAALLLLVLAAPSSAQAPAAAPAEEGPTYFESLEVNVVNVEVFVTDRQGNPVSGLTRDDFTISEDGKPIEISNFYAVSEGKAAIVPGEAAEASEDDPAVPAEPAPAAPAAPIATLATLPQDQRLHLAIFVDNLNLTPQARNKALHSLKGFLAENLSLEDRVLVASYDGSSAVAIRRGPTSDRQALLAAIEEVALGSAQGAQASAERRRLLREINMINMPGNDLGFGALQQQDYSEAEARTAYNGIRLFAQTRYNEIRSALVALDQFVTSMAGLPGRKAVLYVSGGLTLRPAEAIYTAWQNKFPTVARQVSGTELSELDATPLLRTLVDRANANRITFYALGASENMASMGVEQSGGLDAQAMNAVGGGLSTSAREIESIDSASLNESLGMLTYPTGGLAVVDAPNPGAVLNRMRRDFDWYYSLGYAAPRRPDGKRHRIEVKTKDPSLKLRFREGYRSRTAEERMADRTLSALLLGVEDNPLGVSLEFGQETPQEKGNVQVEVLVKLPIAKLALLPQEHFHEGRLALFVGVRDGKGKTSPIQKIDVPIRVPNDQLMTALRQEAAYLVNLLLTPTEHMVAVGVRDVLGNADATVRAAHTPGRSASAQGK